MYMPSHHAASCTSSRPVIIHRSTCAKKLCFVVLLATPNNTVILLGCQVKGIPKPEISEAEPSEVVRTPTFEEEQEKGSNTGVGSVVKGWSSESELGWRFKASDSNGGLGEVADWWECASFGHPPDCLVRHILGCSPFPIAIHALGNNQAMPWQEFLPPLSPSLPLLNCSPGSGSWLA